MAHQLIAESANILDKPNSEAPPGASTQLTLGDLHSNAIKLCYFLTRHGIIEISQRDYSQLVKLYLAVQTEKNVKRFTDIVRSLKVNNRQIILRFLGDELADRGRNDLFILILLEKLYQEKVPVEILLSNHGLEFIEAHERAFQKTRFGYSDARSFYNLQTIIAQKVVSNEEIKTLVKNVYQKLLTLVSFSLNKEENCLTLYSHAPIDLNVIKLLAEKFGVIYNDLSIMKLASTIKAIQEQFYEYVCNDKIHTLYNTESFATLEPNATPTYNNVLEFTTWNRNYSCLVRPTVHNGYKLCYVHGHDSGETTANCIYNLDNQLGKPGYELDIYTVLISNELQPITLFNSYLQQLKQKTIEHSINKQHPAAQATQKCYTKLENYSQNFFNKRISAENFRKNCIESISEVRSELEKHRGWKKILVTTNIVAKSQLRNLPFLQTDSLKLINSLQNSIETLSIVTK